jgi:hypothetical protein
MRPIHWLAAPLNHFDSIIENAKRDAQKGNVLPMQRW